MTSKTLLRCSCSCIFEHQSKLFCSKLSLTVSSLAHSLLKQYYIKYIPLLTQQLWFLMYLQFWYSGSAGPSVASVLTQKEATELAGFLSAEGHCACVCRCGNMIGLGSSVQHSCTTELFRPPCFVLNLSMQRQIKST